MGVCLFLQVTDDKRKWPQVLPGEVQIGYGVKFQKGFQALEQVVQGSG